MRTRSFAGLIASAVALAIAVGAWSSTAAAAVIP